MISDLEIVEEFVSAASWVAPPEQLAFEWHRRREAVRRAWLQSESRRRSQREYYQRNRERLIAYQRQYDGQKRVARGS